MKLNENTQPKKVCPECQGRTIEFRGVGRNLQYRICPLAKAGDEMHLEEEEVNAKYREHMQAHAPRSGRYG